MADPVFVTTIYGAAYAPFLGAHLHSIARAYPRARGVVLWQDLPEAEVAVLALAFPAWRFEKTNLPMHGDVNQRIPRKLHAWKKACELCPEAPVCFIDCDTLVVRPLPELEQDGWDIVYTWKDEVFPINTGVMLARSPGAAAALFTEMAERVERIVSDAGRLAQAVGASGAADQHALREIVGFCNYDKDVTRSMGGRELVFRGVPCKRLNETNCRPITPDLSVIHYKTGWHPILWEGKPFTANRPEHKCREMLEYWRATEREAHAGIAKAAVNHACRGARPRFAPVADGYEERGILNSEMLAVCGLCSALNVDVVIESGRARGQSTLVLGRYFAGTSTRIVSVELYRDADAEFAESRLAAFPNVELKYGDSLALLPRLAQEMAGLRIAVLLDGPKGQTAIDLARALMAQSPSVVAAFLHDTRRDTPQRASLESMGSRVFFTDDEVYVAEFGALDESCAPRPGAAITEHTWRPRMKGHDAIPSYGPTLAVMLPTPARARTTEGAVR